MAQPTQSARDVAVDMVRAEKEADIAALERYLHPEVIFRRASGAIVDKAEFLNDVKRRDRLESELLDDDERLGLDNVTVTLLVWTSDGAFRNVRVLVRDGGVWRCKIWVNTRLDLPSLQIEMLHHVSLPVADLERSRRFYEGVLGLRASDQPRPGRPRFNFDGAWYQVGAGQLHLIVPEAGASPPTYRSGKGNDSRDVHFALRVRSFAAALSHLWSEGYSEEAEDDFKRMKVSPNRDDQGAGFPQIYILDPDRHTVEINAARLD